MALLLATAVATPSTAQEPLTLDVVLDAVDRAFPLLDAARRDADAADGQALRARGAFDLRVSADADVLRGAGYENETASAGLTQPLAVAGVNLFGGYRVGRGTFAPYDGKAQTLSDGEWRAGVSVPLLRNRSIDSRRGALEQTALGRQLAEQRVEASRLRFLGEAALRYWDWVAAGRQQAVTDQLLDLAERRDRDLADAIGLGQIAPIERVDNRRAILQRQSELVRARRQTERQAIGLSLYYRNDDGTLRMPEAQALPPDMPAPPAPLTRAAIDADIATAQEERPDIRALLLQRAQQETAVALARNELLPSLDLFTQVARDAGSGARSLRGTEVASGVTFAVPVQRRQARGEQQVAEAALARIDAELRFARDRVRTEIEDAASALNAALDAAVLVGAEVDVARELEQAERERFTLGDSTQFLVNLRELAAADAATRLIAAIAEAHKARAVYDVATGVARLARTTIRTP
jgi:outer membrane protein TolC